MSSFHLVGLGRDLRASGTSEAGPFPEAGKQELRSPASLPHLDPCTYPRQPRVPGPQYLQRLTAPAGPGQGINPRHLPLHTPHVPSLPAHVPCLGLNGGLLGGSQPLSEDVVVRSTGEPFHPRPKAKRVMGAKRVIGAKKVMGEASGPVI